MFIKILLACFVSLGIIFSIELAKWWKDAENGKNE